MTMSRSIRFAALLTAGLVLAGTAAAQQVASTQAPAAAPESLSLYFDSGSAAIRRQDQAILDQASRLYRDGKPIVMVISGGTDAVGSAALNLALSQRRAEAVLHALVDRGIPVEHFQLLGKGQTEPAVPDEPGRPEPRDRRVEITWR
jgi:outer membrane protein OmpA-like peptidoglycan-associated protein